MYNLAFGTGGWKVVGGVLAIFLLGLFSIIASFAACIFKAQDNWNSSLQKMALVFGVVSLLLSLTSGIMSFCVLPMMGLSGYSNEVVLSGGAISYGVLALFSAICEFIGICLQGSSMSDFVLPEYRSHSEYNGNASAPAPAYTPTPAPAVQPVAKPEPIEQPAPVAKPIEEPKEAKEPSKEQTIKDIKAIKELLDSGAISQEEYDSLKKKYLKQL